MLCISGQAAATALKDVALQQAQTTLDNAKTEIAGEKKLYDDRAAQDIKDRQAQTQSALQEAAKQNTIANDNAANRQRNRRVEITLFSRG